MEADRMDDLSEFGRRLRAILMRRGEGHHDAEDIVQEAFLRFQEVGRAERIRHPKAFLSQVARNLAVDGHRRRSRSLISARPVEDYDLRDFSPGPGEVVDARQRLKRLFAGLSRLSPRSRRILLAQRLERASHAEIARREGITVAGVEKQIARSLQFLVEWMDHES